jgi:hypothetical protein
MYKPAEPEDTRPVAFTYAPARRAERNLHVRVNYVTQPKESTLLFNNATCNRTHAL